MRRVGSAVRVRDEPLPLILCDDIDPIVLLVEHVHHLSNVVFFSKTQTDKTYRTRLTLPRLTSNSSSTQGVKSCRTIILLSGERPFSFSIPTRTSVSIEALPVILPIPGGRIVSLSSAVTKKRNMKSEVLGILKAIYVRVVNFFFFCVRSRFFFVCVLQVMRSRVWWSRKDLFFSRGNNLWWSIVYWLCTLGVFWSCP